MKGYMGFEGILGHEFVGVVVECPPDRADAFLHKRVCADINVCCNDLVECGVCAMPQEGKELVDRMRRNHCPNRSVIGILGRPECFAEYICLPCRNLHVVEDDISEEDACFAEPLAAALRIVEQRLTRVGRRTAIMGDGKLGLLITAALTVFLRSADSASAPTEVYLFGRHDSKLELLEKMSESSSSSGVTLRLCNVNDDEGKRALKDLAHACDCVVEATGNPHGFTQSCELLKPRGTLVLKSTCAAGIERGLNLAPLVIDELSVVGSRCGPIEGALTMLSTGDFARVFPLGALVDEVYPLEEVGDAFQRAGERGALKVVLQIAKA